MSITPEQPAEPVAPTPTATPEAEPVVTIHRAPRYFRFLIAGGVLGLIVALVLTFSFPEPPGFNLPQVFGFLAILFVVVGFAVGAVVALVLDRVSRRRARPITMERETYVTEPDTAPDTEPDTAPDTAPDPYQS